MHIDFLSSFLFLLNTTDPTSSSKIDETAEFLKTNAIVLWSCQETVLNTIHDFRFGKLKKRRFDCACGATGRTAFYRQTRLVQRKTEFENDCRRFFLFQPTCVFITHIRTIHQRIFYGRISVYFFLRAPSPGDHRGGHCVVFPPARVRSKFSTSAQRIVVSGTR